MRKAVYSFVILLLLTHCYAYGQSGCFLRGPDGQLSLIADSLDLADYQGFIIGEFHDVQEVPEIKLALIKYLHEKNGVNDVFMEIGYAAAYLYNRYLATGDTEFLSSPALVYASSREGKAFWAQLYAYTQGAGSITINGMDFERMEFIKALKALRPDGKLVPAGLSTLMHELDTLAVSKVNDSKLMATYNRLGRHFQQIDEACQSFYGVNYPIVQDILKNASRYDKYNDRNETMCYNVQNQVKEKGIKNFAIFAGEKHCDKSDWQTLCGRLHNDSVFRGRILSIAMLCKGCGNVTGLSKIGYRGPAKYVYNETLMNQIYRFRSSQACEHRLQASKMAHNALVAGFSDYLLLIND